MKPCSHYLRYPIGETGWALMKILLNIAGWFLYFAQWQKSRYPCQFTLNSASCRGSLYQGASNAHPLLNDSKATSPDRGLTTPVMHTQDTLARAGNTPNRSQSHFCPNSSGVCRTFESASVETCLGRFECSSGQPLREFHFFLFLLPAVRIFHFLPSYAITQKPLCLLMHIIWCLRHAADAPHGEKRWVLMWLYCEPSHMCFALLYNHPFTFKWVSMDRFRGKTQCPWSLFMCTGVWSHFSDNTFCVSILFFPRFVFKGTERRGKKLIFISSALNLLQTMWRFHCWFHDRSLAGGCNNPSNADDDVNKCLIYRK